FPEAVLWPADPKARAMARSAASEMHAGFAALRKAVPMTVLGRHPAFTPDADVTADIRRITELWQASRERFGADGPWLFGSYSVADIMFAPVAIRFATAGIELDPVSAAWRDTMLNRTDMQRWIREGRAEAWRLPEIDTEFSADWD
ncbi:MAG: glutathione S-transferase, partial [Rhodospirillales bacterium]